MITLHWHTEPILLLSLLLVGWLYAVFTGPLRSWLVPEVPWPRRQGTFFFAGLAIAYLTVGSPLDQLGEDFLFSAHMLQHMLLIYLLPVCFFFGTPSWLIDALLKFRPLRQAVSLLVHPVVAGSLFTLSFTLWHIPVLYESALHSKWLHVWEHATLFAPALFMWWPILSPSQILPARSYGVRMIYIFLLMIGQLPVFGFLTFSGQVLYPTYEFAPRLDFFNLTPLDDQTLGGVIMKIVNMSVSLTVFGISFYRWAAQGEDKKSALSERARVEVGQKKTKAFPEKLQSL